MKTKQKGDEEFNAVQPPSQNPKNKSLKVYEYICEAQNVLQNSTVFSWCGSTGRRLLRMCFENLFNTTKK